jgi:hypothetical protein
MSPTKHPVASTDFPTRYEDPTYEETHRTLLSGSLLRPLEPVLPPGISQGDFDAAIGEFVAVVGKAAVFIGKALEDYVDPYELFEVEGKRRVPSAAAWLV